MRRRGRECMAGDRAACILFVLAAVLLSGSAVGSSRAALSYYSGHYVAQIRTSDIGVALMENGKDISWQNHIQKEDGKKEGRGRLLEGMQAEGKEERICVGRDYEERLTVRNTGSIDEYVKVVLYRYWEDPAGNKRTDLSPGLIRLHLTEDGWLEDPAASTDERTVLYYRDMLGVGEQSPAFMDTLTVDEAAAASVTTETKKEDGYTTVTTAYVYDGMRFVLEAEVSAVQTHHAAEAIRSAWGAGVSVHEDGTLHLPGQEAEE